MKGQKNRQKMIYNVLAVAVFGVLLLLFHEEKLPWYRNQIDIIVMGDSIVGAYREETSVTNLMEEMLGEPVYNGALGGTCCSYTSTGEQLSYTNDAMNLAGLSQAIYADDFRPQLNARIRSNATEYFFSIMIDFSLFEYENMDVVFLSYGMNDYHAAVPYDNPENAYDPYTFQGALRYSVKNIREAYPNLRIIMVTPTYSWYLAEGLTCEEYDTGNGVLEDYVEAQLAVAEELDLEVIDLYHDFYSHDSFEEWQNYTVDGLHPNETGRRMIAEKLATYLKENP